MSDTRSDWQLVADLLSHYKDRAPGFAHAILEYSKGLHGLIGGGAEEACNAVGVSPHAARRLATAVEIGVRIARAEVGDKYFSHEPEAAARYLFLKYARPTQEVLGILMLDSRMRILGDKEIHRGSMKRSIADPATIFRAALVGKAAAIILFHNHPAGDPLPSSEDIQFTKRIREAGRVLGLPVIDHLILGEGGKWHSMASDAGWA